MRIDRIQQSALGSGLIIDLDLDTKGQPMGILQSDGQKRLATSGLRLSSIPTDALSQVITIRSVGDSAAIVGPVVAVTDEVTETCALVTNESFATVPFGAPACLFLGGPYCFATYTERVLLFARTPSFEDDIVTVFDVHTHSKLLGLSDLLTRARDEPTCYEVTSACATAAGELAFVGLGAPHLWIMDPKRRRFTVAALAQPLPSADLIEALATSGPNILIMTTGPDALELITLDRGGNTLSRSTLPAAPIHQALGAYASQAPAGDGWRLDAAVRGLDGGRFLIHTADSALLLTV